MTKRSHFGEIWTTEDEDLVLDMRADGKSFAEIAERLPSRTAESVESRFRMLMSGNDLDADEVEELTRQELQRINGMFVARLHALHDRAAGRGQSHPSMAEQTPFVPNSIRSIVLRAASFAGVRTEDIVGRATAGELTRIRAAVAYVAHSRQRKSSEIARVMKRNRTSIDGALVRARAMMAEDPNFAAFVHQLGAH